ncbi:MAG TPA: molybdopterin-binding/glycosyltransferase family 2 protein [Rhabdaerophilum sp.]|nr:molybdopterin-binding/glycosyltransferase family 2 protein [Rhabdaerophilum sp.]
MKFGSVPVAEAGGGILAHQVRAGEIAFRVLSAEDCAALAAAGLDAVTVARLEAGDVGEDEAARRLAHCLAGPSLRIDPAFTGRANLFADAAGLLVTDRTAIDRFNALDPAMTIATLPAYKRVEPGEMVATVKIIPFAVPGTVLDAGIRALSGALRVAPYSARRVAMLSLRLPGLKESVIDKTVRMMEARLAALGSALVLEHRLDHRQDVLETALATLDPATFDLLVIFGAAAIADRRDVIPAAIEAAGGRIEHFGMPVDPGNLLLLGEWRGLPFIGAPGCARSPRENGFDWVLARLCADLPVGAAEVQGMGVGGLLMEIVSRPQPRAGKETIPGGEGAVAALILAAGRSTRFGAANKLLAEVHGRPMLAHVLGMVEAAGISSRFLVTGHEADAVRALAGEAQVIENPDYQRGLSTSIRAGLAAMPEAVGAAFILLGDMPRVRPQTLETLVAASEKDPSLAFVPVFEGRWGNPVLVRRALFPSLMQLHGDHGARKLLEASREAVREVPVDDPGVLADFDTPDALAGQ